MDTSEQYIKMCGKAGEIQEKWQPAAGDRCAEKTEYEDFAYYIYLISEYGKLYFLLSKQEGPFIEDLYALIEFEKRTKYIWLPHQDQLQEMIGDYKKTIDYPEFEWDFNREQFTSWEQLWLGFAMHSLYQKQWDGEDWILERG